MLGGGPRDPGKGSREADLDDAAWMGKLRKIPSARGCLEKYQLHLRRKSRLRFLSNYFSVIIGFVPTRL